MIGEEVMNCCQFWVACFRARESFNDSAKVRSSINPAVLVRFRNAAAPGTTYGNAPDDALVSSVAGQYDPEGFQEDRKVHRGRPLLKVLPVQPNAFRVSRITAPRYLP